MPFFTYSRSGSSIQKMGNRLTSSHAGDFADNVALAESGSAEEGSEPLSSRLSVCVFCSRAAVAASWRTAGHSGQWLFSARHLASSQALRRDPERAPSETGDVQEWVCNNIYLRLGGLDSTTDEHVVWFASEIRVGDETSVQVLEPGEFDPPVERNNSTCSLGPRPRHRQGPRRKRHVRGPSWRK